MLNNKNIKLLLSFTLIIFIGLCIGHSFVNLKAEQIPTLQKLLNLNQQKKEALTILLQKAEIIKTDQTFDKAFPQRKTKQELIQDFLYILQKTQEKFSARKPKQERWEVIPPSWFDRLQQNEAERIFNTLEYLQEIKPKILDPYAVCILGSTYPTMKQRMSFAANLIKTDYISTDNLILLAGERYVSIDTNIDCDEKTIKEIAKRQQINEVKKLTETNLLVDIYENSPLYKNISTIIINTPRGELPRPTTESTLTELLKKLKEYPEIITILFISSQPYVAYQRAIIKTVLSTIKSNLTIVEVIGTAYAEQEINKNSRDKINTIIASIGSTLWAEAPLNLERHNLTIEQPEQIEAFCSLYKNNPILLKKIKTICIEKNN